MRATVYTLTDDWNREYEASVREEIQEIHRPYTTIYQKILVIDCVKYRGLEVKNFQEVAVLDDIDTQIKLAHIDLGDWL